MLLTYIVRDSNKNYDDPIVEATDKYLEGKLDKNGYLEALGQNNLNTNSEEA